MDINYLTCSGICILKSQNLYFGFHHVCLFFWIIFKEKESERRENVTYQNWIVFLKLLLLCFISLFMYFTQDKVRSKNAPKSINGTNKVQNKSQICHIVYICHKMNASFKDAPFPHFPPYRHRHHELSVCICKPASLILTWVFYSYDFRSILPLLLD